MQTNESTYGSSDKSALDQCNSYIRWQTRPSKQSLSADASRPSGPTVTISYQTGAGAHEIAGRLAKHLQADDSKEDNRWTFLTIIWLEKCLRNIIYPNHWQSI